MQLQREQLQIKALQADERRKEEHHKMQMERERDVRHRIKFDSILILFLFQLHALRLKHEDDIHLQRLRNEQELHQIKVAEYNKVQTSYPIMYK